MQSVESARKTLKILGILSIIGGAIGLIMAVVSFAGGGLVAGSMATPGAIDAADMEGAAAATGLLLVAGGILVISGVFSLLLGIFSVRASNDFSKIGPAYVLAIMNLVMTVISVAFGLVGGAGIDFSSILSSVVSVALSCAIFMAAKTIKENA